MNDEKIIYAQHDTDRGTLKMYISGFVLSIVLTLAAYFLVSPHAHSGAGAFTHPVLVIVILVLAVAQFLVQIFFFLHLGREAKPRWKRLLLALMITIVLILVLGSIWIMYHLNSRMMPSKKQMIQYMNQQGGGM